MSQLNHRFPPLPVHFCVQEILFQSDCSIPNKFDRRFPPGFEPPPCCWKQDNVDWSTSWAVPRGAIFSYILVLYKKVQWGTSSLIKYIWQAHDVHGQFTIPKALWSATRQANTTTCDIFLAPVLNFHTMIRLQQDHFMDFLEVRLYIIKIFTLRISSLFSLGHLFACFLCNDIKMYLKDNTILSVTLVASMKYLCIKDEALMCYKDKLMSIYKVKL